MVFPFLQMSASLLQRACQRATRCTKTFRGMSSRSVAATSQVRRAASWSSRSAACCVGATLMLLVLAPRSVLGQEPELRPAIATTIDPPDVTTAMRVYREIEGFVRAWKVTEPNEQAERFPGVAITLRLDGSVVGRGVDLSDQPGGVERASSLALREADARLPLPWDATREARRSDLAKSIEISVEIAGPLVPFRADTWGDVDMGLSPGLWGVSARFGEKLAGVFPGNMLMSGQSPSDGLRAAISDASGNPQLATLGVQGQPGKIASEHGATFYRFRVTHLAQASAGEAPVFLHRGGQIVPRSAITTASLREFAVHVAGHLKARCQAVSGGASITAMEWPSAKYTSAEAASTLDTALAAYALARFSKVVGLSAKDSAESVAMARSLLGGVRVKARDDSGEAVVEAAMLLLAWQEVGGDEREGGELLPVVRTQLARALDESRAWRAETPESARGLVLLAMVRDAKFRGLDAKMYDVAARAIYRDAPGAKVLAHMPWLAMVERELADTGGELKAASALRDALDQMWKTQVTQDEAGTEDMDMTGGFVFSGTGTPLPTWHSLRAMAFGSVALRDRRIVDAGDRLTLIGKLVSTARFARQLALDAPAGHLAARRATALWGIRAAVWDFKQPVSASAMALIALSEMVDGLGEQ